MAFEPLGFAPAWFSEIEPFPAAVLAHHWPHVTNLGDMTRIAEQVANDNVPAPDVLVGGTPCQAFSVAGARRGLEDDRGFLTIKFVELADAIDQQRAENDNDPAIIVWENVPGVLSSKDNAFGAFLGLLSGEDCELVPPRGKWTNAGYVSGPKRAIAWRILDAQYFGVAQRRRRVFVVASAREGFDPAKVLFEREGVRRDTPPSREAGKAVAALTANGVGTCGADDNQGQAGHLIPAIMSVHGTQDPDTNIKLAHTLGRNQGQENAVAYSVSLRGREGGATAELGGEVAGCLRASSGGGDKPHVLAQCATGRGQPIVPVAFSSKDYGGDATENMSPTLRACGHADSHANAGAPPAVAYPILEVGKRTGSSTTDPRAGLGVGSDGDPMFTLQAGAQHGVAYGIRTANTSSNGWGIQEEVTHTLDTAQGIAVAAFAENSRAEVRIEGGDGQITGALSTGGGKVGQGYPAVVSYSGFDILGTPASEVAKEADVHTPLRARVPGQFENSTVTMVANGMAVRRLTPVECERLQGFPDGHTDVPYRGKAAADGPRYKAIGNSMAVPCMAWIGQRIKLHLEAL